MSVPPTQSRPRLQRVSRRAVMRSATSTYADVCREDVRLASPRPGVPLVALRRAAMRCDALWRAALRRAAICRRAKEQLARCAPGQTRLVAEHLTPACARYHSRGFW